MLDLPLSILAQLDSSLSFSSLQSTFSILSRLQSNIQLDRHDEEVKRLARQVKSLKEHGVSWRVDYRAQPYRLGGKSETVLSLSHLNSILRISSSQKTALVEPSVPYAALLREARRYGLEPAFVHDKKEFEPAKPGVTTIEVLSDTESSIASVNWAECILPVGEVSTLWQPSGTDVFLGGNKGLATVTLLEIALIVIE